MGCLLRFVQCLKFEGGISLSGGNPVCWCVIVIRTIILVSTRIFSRHIFLIMCLNF